MARVLLRGMGFVLVAAGSVLAAAQGPASSTPATTSPHRATLNRYCVTCHNERLRTAGLSLEKIDTERVSEQAETWEKVLRKLRAGDMPPAGVPRPDAATSGALVSHLETALDGAAAANLNPGRPQLSRLNRTEYANAIRDLLEVEIDGAALLPADDSRHGFDNIGNVLTLSPLLAERYLAVARKVRRLALGDPEIRPAVEFYDVSKYLLQGDRVAEALPFGSRGGVAVRHHFPADGEYDVKVRLQRNSRDYIRGLGEAHTLDVRLDDTRIHRFTIGGEKRGRSAGIFSTASMGDVAQEQYEHNADEVLQFRFQVTAGSHVVGVAFVKESAVPEGPLQQPMTLYDIAQYKGGEPGVASIAIGGPYNPIGSGDTVSRRRILTCRPATPDQQEPCARMILAALARRAYRRPVTAAEMETLLSFYRSGASPVGADAAFEAGLGLALDRMLAGPEFLFRIERDPANAAPGTAYAISDLELASRLSFFLWSSIPDDELVGVAESGQLKQPPVLEQQVRRMLADARSNALVTSFAAQWLYLRNLRAVAPDLEKFPYFDENLRQAFRRETELFFESILREDRSVLDLLNADYTFVNERLARHYEIPGIYGSQFRRVQLPDGIRGGLLGQGSILTVTSYSNRTSPVIRGKWVLANLLSSPPPPPPPNVPELKDRNSAGKILSMRQRMEQHRANPVCAGCHKVMDPLGFALENFDGIGRWRTTDAGSPIDSSGMLPDGTAFEGPAELRKALLSKRRDQFVWTVTERLLTYALGRGVEYYDAPAMRRILRESAAADYRFSSLVLSIVNSTPFQMRRSEQP